MNLNFEAGFQMPSVNIIWYPLLFMATDKWKYNIYRFLLHTIPALIADLLLILTGRKPMCVF